MTLIGLYLLLRAERPADEVFFLLFVVLAADIAACVLLYNLADLLKSAGAFR